MKFLAILALVLIIALVDGRHTHPRGVIRIDEGDNSETITEIDGLPIEVIRNLTPNRFVPINSVRFFNNYKPCKEGFERDLLGVCREVWD